MSEYLPQTVEDLAAYWLYVYARQNKAPSSIKRDQGIFRNYILPKFGDLKITDLKTREIEAWIGDIPLSQKSTNEILGLFKKILNDACRWGFIDKNPAAFVKKKKIMETEMLFWSLEDVRQYLGYWGGEEDKPRMYYPVLLAVYTGMRRGELIGLSWKDVDLKEGFITVKESYCRVSEQVRESTKSKKIRKIPICTILKKHLEDLFKLTESTDYVLPFFHPDHYNREFKRSSLEAGVKNIRFHDLRHTFASHFLMGGGNIYALCRILGHSSVKVTERYVHILSDYLKGKTEVLAY